jgi:hypothetical protein
MTGNDYTNLPSTLWLWELFGVVFSTLFGVSSAERKTLIRMIALASLSESARKIALDRFRLLQPHLEEKRLLKAVARDAGIGALGDALSQVRVGRTCAQ